MVSLKKCLCKNKQNFALYVINVNDETTLHFIHIECAAIIKKFKLNLSKINQDFKLILDEINAYSKNEKPKGAIFDIFVNPSFKNAYQLREWFKDYCIFENIPYQFINMNILIISSILHGANVKNSSKITILHGTLKSANATNLIKNGNVFKIKDNSEMNSALGRIDYSKYEESDKIILVVDDPVQRKAYQKTLNAKKLFILNGSYTDYLLPTLINMVKDINGTGINDFKIFPNFISNCVLSIQQKSAPFHGNFYLNKWDGITLPYTEIFVAHVEDDEKLCVNALSNSGKKYECLKTYEFSSLGYIRIKLVIDMDGFYNVKLEALDEPLSPFLTNQKNGMVSINLSDLFIGIHIHTIKDNSGDGFIFPYISFYDENVIGIGRNAKDLILKYPTFVVYDLFKIIEVIHAGASPDPKWKFSIRKNSAGVSYVIFDTWRGKRKATPEFLMAILINHLLNLAKKHIGFIPKNIKVTINTSAVTGVFKETVSNACKILDVDCSFSLYKCF